MIRKLFYLLMVIAFFGSQTLEAQDFRKKANKQFKLKAFELAAFNYKQVLNEQPDNGEVMLKLAKCYYNLNNNLAALRYFATAENRIELNKEDLITYGNAARKIADYDKARAVYQNLKAVDAEKANHYLLSCDYAEKLLKETEVFDLYTFGGNTTASDFGAVAYRDNWIFASLRNDLALNHKDKVPSLRLYSSQEIVSKNSSVTLLHSSIIENYKIGPVSFSGDYTLCATMKNNIKEGQLPVYSDDNEGLIMIGQVSEDGVLSRLKPFRYNETESSTAFPSLSSDGDVLYFSSNRKGGYGGFDIYVSYFRNGVWTEPQNLGPNVNSKGNEITPFINEQTLYFASDYLHGLGGYDIFKSEMYNGVWTYPANLGNGLNSPADDLFPFLSEETGKIYFSSNRLGSLGGLDIYVAYKDIEYPIVNNNQLNNKIMAREERFSMPMVQTVSTMGAKYTFKDFDDRDVERSGFLHKVESDNLSASEEIRKYSNEEAIPKAYVLPELSAKKSYVPSNWEGAKRVSLDSKLLPGKPVYFIQVAALSKNKASADKFRELSKFGNVYTQRDAQLTKVRLGYFVNEYEAKKILLSIKSMGYSDAFITQLPLNTSEMELIASNHDLDASNSYMTRSKFKGKSNYKVRLASYSDPIWFDISKAKVLGKIEQWTKGGWTIFLSSGYLDKNAAEKARVKALNLGFMDAELVFDNNGILEKVRNN